jgi:hypothetical protein
MSDRKEQQDQSMADASKKSDGPAKADPKNAKKDPKAPKEEELVSAPLYRF